MVGCDPVDPWVEKADWAFGPDPRSGAAKIRELQYVSDSWTR